jgi:putative ABC transport system permease protein
MRNLPQDVRFAVRSLWRSPALALTAVGTLAIGIGANTAIFSVVNAILLQALPFHNPDRLVRLYETEAAPGKYPFAGPDFIDWKTQNRTFDDMALLGWPRPMNLSGNGQPDSVLCVPTAANFFSMLGVSPVIGRTWAAGEDQPGHNSVAVLSYATWSGRYAADRNVLGRTLELNSKTYTIVGVMPRSFRFPSEAQLWIPQDMSAKGLGQRGNHSFLAVGRMKAGVTPAAALADLRAIAAGLERDFPDSNHKVGAALVPLHEDLAGYSRDSLLVLLSAVGLVLLIACANVANLLLSRAVSRQKEMAVRTALGAGRARLLGQLLTESLVLSVAGGVMGLGLGWALVQLLSNASHAGIPGFTTVHLDGTVLAFTAALAIVTGIVFGLFPALQASRPNFIDELKGGAGSSLSPNRRRRFTTRALVVGEFALSLLLLSSAGLLLKSFFHLRQVETGVRTEGIWTAAVRLPNVRYPGDPERRAFTSALIERTRQIPGVIASVATSRLPVEGGGNYYVTLRGETARAEHPQLVEYRAVTPGYFQALDIRIVQGRDYSHADAETMAVVSDRWNQWEKAGHKPTPAETNPMISPTVINQTMAKTFWPNQDPIGKMFGNGPNGPWRQVIGVAADTRQRGLSSAPAPEACDLLYGDSSFHLLLRTTLPPAAVSSSVRRVLGQMDSSLPLFDIRTMDDVLDGESGGKRFLALLVGCFAAVAALLAAIGIYGVLSCAVGQRTREIGIRVALGADRARVLGEVLREGAVLAGAGFAIGIAGALAAGRLLAHMLFEVRPSDPAVIVTAAAALAAVALAACYLPARRAASLNPIEALRQE